MLHPVVLSVRPGLSDDVARGKQVILDLHIPPSLVHFAGHFPGLPIVPGVVQIDWVMHYAREHLGLSGHFKALENIKFLTPLQPDARLELHLTWIDTSRRLEFVFKTPQRTYASGRFVMGEAA